MFLRDVVAAAFPTLCPCGAPGDPVCASCLRAIRVAPNLPLPAGLDGWVAPFAYEGVVRELVARVKYRHVRATLPWLGAAVADAVSQRYAAAAFDAVTWAPTAPDRRRRRGFDHAELLARHVARVLRLPLRPTLTRRRGPPQTGRPLIERRGGPVFEPRSHIPRRILVVDDVATTGGTLTAAAAALRGSGAERVVAATAARTPAVRTRVA